jgi:IclR family acetate operon transcriptional repressor
VGGKSTSTLLPPPPKRPNTVQSVDRALDILETLAASKNGMALSDLAGRVTLNASTCHHLLQTLLQRSYVEQDAESKRYSLGNRILHLQYGRTQQIDMAAQALPILQELNDTTGESIHLATLQVLDLVTLLKLESLHPVRVDNSLVGKTHAAHATATGKAILAFLPEGRLAALLQEKGLRGFTDRTVRRQGFAVDDEEFQPGVYCVGAPVRDHTGKVVASISVSMPVMRVTKDRIEEIIRLAKQASLRISERLGYSL